MRAAKEIPVSAGGPVGAATGAVIATVASVAPVFMLGGFSVLMEPDLGFTEAGLGAAVAIYFAVCAVSSVPTGALVQRFGPATVTRAGIVVGAGSMLAMATVVQSYAALIAVLVIAGFANSAGQLGSNLSLAERIPARRQGISYGIKQAAIPVATLLAGLAVPAIGLTLGWRWAFGLAGALALAALLAVPRSGQTGRRRTGDKDAKTGALIVLALGAAIAAGSANALGTFLVPTAVEHGVNTGTAGLVLSLGSVFGICCRVGAGWIADRRPNGHLLIVVVMLTLGSGGLALLAAPHPVALVVGTIVGFGLGWAWPGVLNFAVVRLNPSAPAAATSITQSGVYAGGTIGPLGFGALVQATSFPTAWLAAAASMLVAAVFIYAGTRMLTTSPAPHPTSSRAPGSKVADAADAA